MKESVVPSEEFEPLVRKCSLPVGFFMNFGGPAGI